MIARIRFVATAWLVGAVLLGVASFAGGDLAIVAGWLFLVWTLPFGVIWWFALYDHAVALFPRAVVQPAGVAGVILIAFLFWFVVVPAVRRLSVRGPKNT